MYRYLGVGRMQLWFLTPNICATFLVMAILLSIGLFLIAQERKHWWGYGLAAAAALAILLQQLMLAATYSRGGYIAFAVGILSLWFLVRRRAVWIFGLTGLAAILLVANGAERVKSIAGVVSDASIGNRLWLWRGAAGIIQDYWLCGVKSPELVYYNWYQPLWLPDVYGNMIHDLLTIGTRYGIGAVWLYGFLFCALLYGGVRIADSGFRAPWLGALVAAVAGYGAAAGFSTMYEYDDLFFIIVPLLTITAIAEIVLLSRRHLLRSWSLFGIPAGVATGFCLALLLFGAWVNRTRPYAAIRENPGSSPKKPIAPAGSRRGQAYGVR